MKEFILTQEETERTVLVGLITNTQNEAKANEYLDELAFLAETAGALPVKKFLQRLDTPNSRDSRYWGLLPESYIVGKATRIWKSKDPADGHIRWDRVFKKIE